MKLHEIMTSDPEVVSPDSTVSDAAEKMRRLDVGAIPVCDGKRLVGMMTDRDITIRSTAKGIDPKQAKVKDHMTPEVFYCFEDEDVTQAEKTMEEKQVRRLPILDRDKNLVGIVSLGDIAVDSENQKMVAETLREVSEPAEPRR